MHGGSVAWGSVTRGFSYNGTHTKTMGTHAKAKLAQWPMRNLSSTGAQLYRVSVIQGFSYMEGSVARGFS